MKDPATIPSRSVSTARVVRTWPLVPFWLRRRESPEKHLALPGAALAAAAILAALMAEPGLYLSGLRLFFFDLPAGSLEILSLLAPLTAAAMLAGHRGGAESWWKWAVWLPAFGLFALARALAGLDRAGPEPAVELPPSSLRSRPFGIAATIRRVRGALLSLAGRKSIAWQGLLFGSHLGWPLAAAGRLAEPGRSWGFLLLGVVCLHLLAFAGARLMTRSARRHDTLSPGHWAGDCLPPCLLLPVPFNLAAIGLWFLTRTQEEQDSLAAGAFGAHSPFARMASFRQRLPAGGGFAAHFKGWNRDPYSRLPESRLKSERRWTECHRIALFFQALALLGALGPPDRRLTDLLLQVFWILVGITLLSPGLYALLSISGRLSKSSRGLSGLGRLAGVAFAVMLALAASPLWSQRAGKAFGWLALVAGVGAVVSLLGVPIDILATPGRIRTVPAALLRAICFAVLAILLALAGSFQAPSGAAQIQLVATLAAASFFASPLFVYLAHRCQAPALVRSCWLCLPFSALLLPLLPTHREPAANHSAD